MSEPLKAEIKFFDEQPGKTVKECTAGGTDQGLKAIALSLATAEELQEQTRRALTARLAKNRLKNLKARKAANARQIANRGKSRPTKGQQKVSRKLKSQIKQLKKAGKVPTREVVRKELEEALEKAGKLAKVLRGAKGAALAAALVDGFIEIADSLLKGETPDLGKITASIAKAAAEGFISGALAAFLIATIGGIAATAAGELIIGVVVALAIGALIESLEKSFGLGGE